jgi:hypothetical protein
MSVYPPPHLPDIHVPIGAVGVPGRRSVRNRARVSGKVRGEGFGTERQGHEIMILEPELLYCD